MGLMSDWLAGILPSGAQSLLRDMCAATFMANNSIRRGCSSACCVHKPQTPSLSWRPALDWHPYRRAAMPLNKYRVQTATLCSPISFSLVADPMRCHRHAGSPGAPDASWQRRRPGARSGGLAARSGPASGPCSEPARAGPARQNLGRTSGQSPAGSFCPVWGGRGAGSVSFRLLPGPPGACHALCGEGALSQPSQGCGLQSQGRAGCDLMHLEIQTCFTRASQLRVHAVNTYFNGQRV